MTGAEPTRRRVLVIDDDDVMLDSCRRILQSSGYDVEVERDGIRGRERAIEGGYDLVLVDMMLPGLDGLDLIAAVRERRSDVELVVVTGYATVATAVTAVKRGAFDFLPALSTPEELRARAAAAIGRLDERDRARAHVFHGPGTIGDSPQMAHVHALVNQVAPTEATVLIVGESGTGKELLA